MNNDFLDRCLIVVVVLCVGGCVYVVLCVLITMVESILIYERFDESIYK